MTDFSHIRDEEESDLIREIRSIAQEQFIDLSEKYLEVLKNLEEERNKNRNLLLLIEQLKKNSDK